MIRHYILGCVLASSLILLVSSFRGDDFADLPGPYCENIGCCNNRLDSCSVPILGTLCYCDEFCNSSRVDDCCPDYWSHCRGITFPTTERTRPTPPQPPENITGCQWGDRTLFLNQKVKDNCNECTCARQSELLCERNVCLVDQNIIETVNRNPDEFGWTAQNYSEFWGRTLDDGVQFRLGTLPPQRFVMTMNPVKRIYDPNSLPRDFDSNSVWRGLITGIQDQGWCGSSWAISTAAVASDRYGIVSKGKEAVTLSAQNLVSCDTQGQQSCTGGHLDRAWSFTKAYGLVDEDCFPYVARNERCTIKRRGTLEAAGCRQQRFAERRGRYTVGPAYRLGNETDIMYEITRSGPVQATMKVYHDLFTYSGGIYKHSDLAVNHKQGYHSVRIVGWGEEYNYRGVQKYWKVANSWGANWGEDGYFRIVRGTNECEIESFVIASWPHVSRKILLSNELGTNSVY
ncbi:tubulointerstitial nephritis antigen-like [Diabrotica virgifera virgifera]|uniref:SMB domain-containing protein n=1 Tax=Diabrotica virgifera virgifera TaxID=50390 RepID=A0ABM5KIU4_DIAVI|nr:tubulointerstitial nephritis antigen-like [Diabrotica virgifera virgifera]